MSSDPVALWRGFDTGCLRRSDIISLLQGDDGRFGIMTIWEEVETKQYRYKRPRTKIRSAEERQTSLLFLARTVRVQHRNGYLGNHTVNSRFPRRRSLFLGMCPGDCWWMVVTAAVLTFWVAMFEIRRA